MRLLGTQKLLDLRMKRKRAIAGLRFQFIAANNTSATGFIMHQHGIVPHIEQLILPIDVVPAQATHFASAQSIQERQQYRKMQIRPL